MKLWCIGICVLWLSLNILAKDDEKRIVCYYGSWAVYRPGNGSVDIEDIDPNVCTHLVYSFAGLSEEGEIKILDPWLEVDKKGLERFNELKLINTNLKTMIAIGGWNEGSEIYSQVVGNETLRSNFVESIVSFLIEYKFNGIDMDWEYPNQRGGVAADVENFSIFLCELRNRLDAYGFILSAAVAAAESSASLSYNVSSIAECVHFINLMTYDFHGSWDSVTGHNTPLAPSERETTDLARSLNIEAAVTYWLEQGAPAEKINLGTAAYGKTFNLTDSSENGVGVPVNGAGEAGPYTQEAGTLGYNEICELQMQESWTVNFDPEQYVPYASYGNQWVSYDNKKSITAKAHYIKTMGLGGALIWSVETDDPYGICGEKYPILNTLNQQLRTFNDSSANKI